MAENPELQTMRAGTIRLTLDARIVNDLGALQSGLKNLADRLGHPSCASGCDVLLIGMEREFVINSKRELNPQPLPPKANVVLSNDERFVTQAPVSRITVSVPTGVLSNIEKLNQVTASVLGKLGCPNCCSGFDIEFRRQLENFRVDDKLNVERVARIG